MNILLLLVVEVAVVFKLLYCSNENLTFGGKKLTIWGKFAYLS